jgi:hypothetical protein
LLKNVSSGREKSVREREREEVHRRRKKNTKSKEGPTPRESTE